MLTLGVEKLTPAARLPLKAHPGDAGFDLYLPRDVHLTAGCPARIPLGIRVAIPDGWFALVRDRSGMAARGYVVTGGVMDSSYRGEWSVLLTSRYDSMIEAGTRVAQFVLLPVPDCRIEEAEELGATARGSGGFGSTGL